MQPFRSDRTLCPWQVNDSGGAVSTGGILAALIEAREETIVAQYGYLEAQKRELATWKALYKMLNLDT